MARRTYFPDRGDIVHLNFQPSAGHEQTGRRYGIVLSPRSYNRAAGLAVCCPITSQVKGYPFEVAVGGTSCAALCSATRFAAWTGERGMQFTEKAPESVLKAVANHVVALVART